MDDVTHDRDPFEALTQDAVRFVAEELAFVCRRGDAIALKGELGAGKTTFARAFISALLDNVGQEIPSPTYTLVQHYETPRFNVAHFDFYRLGDPFELNELGLDHALVNGVALIEWPERAQDQLPDDRLEIEFFDASAAASSESETHDRRTLNLTGHGSWRARVSRLFALHRAIKEAGFVPNETHVAYLQGDASVRRYARIRDKARSALVMDWPAQADGPDTRAGLAYSQIAHLAEDVRPFLAVGQALRQEGLSAPCLLSQDSSNGIIVIEDLGDGVFQKLVSDVDVTSAPTQEDLWSAAIDTLVALRSVPLPEGLPVPNGSHYRMPAYDRDALMMEVELLLDWYLTSLPGQGDLSDELRAAYVTLWDRLIGKVLHVQPGSNTERHVSWVLRDFHSPNLIWLPEREGIARVGLIDFQDAVRGPAAYDVVSLLQDARVDVPKDLEQRLLDRYCAKVAEREPDFDKERFLFEYAVLGAQRNTKILGIFARLAKRDHKPHYLSHIPRIWRYLACNLEHQELEDLRTWYDRAIPESVRARPLLV